MADRPTVLVVGAASRDLDPADPRGWRLGGTVTYASLAIARLGVGVRTLIGVDDEAASAHELGLLVAAGCEIELARLPHGPVFENLQTSAGRRQVAYDVSDQIPVGELPLRWRDSDTVLLGPVAGELGGEWAEAFAPASLVALGWQGLLRRLERHQPVLPLPVQPSPLLARAEIALVSAEDLAATSRAALLADLLPRVGQQLLITNGPQPALHLRRSADGFRARTLAPPTAGVVRDTTGAGDVLLGSWLAGVAAARAAGQPATADQLLRVAFTAATLHVEAGALAQMPDLRRLCDRLTRRVPRH
jgi:sugar/nucleoside kinase (ribokinase family)